MKRQLTILFTCLLTLAKFGFAESGKDAGNGGDGLLVEVNNEKIVYLADLVEFGNYQDVYIGETEPMPVIQEHLDTYLGHLEGLPLKELASKFTEIFQKDPVFGTSLLKTISLYAWTITDKNLHDIDDGDFTNKVDEKGQLVQLAVRKEKAIKISSDYWKRTPLDHKAALIIHEALYASANTFKFQQIGRYNIELLTKNIQSSQMVRDTTALLFDQQFKNMPARKFAGYLNSGLHSESSDYLKTPWPCSFCKTEYSGKVIAYKVLDHSRFEVEFIYTHAFTKEQRRSNNLISQLIQAFDQNDVEDLCLHQFNYVDSYDSQQPYSADAFFVTIETSQGRKTEGSFTKFRLANSQELIKFYNPIPLDECRSQINELRPVFESFNPIQ